MFFLVFGVVALALLSIWYVFSSSYLLPICYSFFKKQLKCSLLVSMTIFSLSFQAKILLPNQNLCSSPIPSMRAFVTYLSFCVCFIFLHTQCASEEVFGRPKNISKLSSMSKELVCGKLLCLMNSQIYDTSFISSTMEVYYRLLLNKNNFTPTTFWKLL